ncbi:unnamed protein product [marine sediment metagenome]|uniref:Uncharacterized protein n=1 Tax=marine sediment metagenome TaxID=412755 RepID=X0SBS0_9ZZZZ
MQTKFNLKETVFIKGDKEKKPYIVWNIHILGNNFDEDYIIHYHIFLSGSRKAADYLIKKEEELFK